MNARPWLRRWVRMGVVLVVAVTLQMAVFSDLPAWGAVADLMLLTVVAAASVTNPNRGALYGFTVGMVYDLVLGTPFGLSALVYTLVGYGVGAVSSWFADPGWRFYTVLAAVAGAVAVLTTVGLALLLGLVYPAADVLRIAAVVAAWNALLILPVREVLAWATGALDEDDAYWVALP